MDTEFDKLEGTTKKEWHGGCAILRMHLGAEAIDSTISKEFVLYAANPDSIPYIPYGPQNPARSDPWPQNQESVLSTVGDTQKRK